MLADAFSASLLVIMWGNAWRRALDPSMGRVWFAVMRRITVGTTAGLGVVMILLAQFWLAGLFGVTAVAFGRVIDIDSTRSVVAVSCANVGLACGARP